MDEIEEIVISDEVAKEFAVAEFKREPLHVIARRHGLDLDVVSAMLATEEYQVIHESVRQKHFSELDKRSDDAAAVLQDIYAQDAARVAQVWRSILLNPKSSTYAKMEAAKHLDKRIAGKERIRSTRENQPADAGVIVHQTLNIAILEETRKALVVFKQFIDANPTIEVSSAPE